MSNFSNISKKLFLILFSVLCSISALYSQITNYTNGTSQNIATSFVFPKIEVKAKQSFFNILNIKNNSPIKFTGSVQFDVPNDWSFVGDPIFKLNIESGDSVNIPVRVMVSSKVLGEIAYVVVASILDNIEKPIKSEYCFITVPRVPDTKVKLTNSMAYFDQRTNNATFNYSIHNRGNVNEVVSIELLGPADMIVNNSKKNKMFTKDISLPPHTDSTIVFQVGIEDKDEIQQFYKIDIKTSTQDTIFNNSIWLNRIDNSDELIIPEQNKCAIVELSINDLFSNSPSYSIMAKGAVLFKYYSDIYYFYQGSSSNSQNFWGVNTRAYIGFNNRNFHLQLGTLESKLEQWFYGRGVEGSVSLKNTKIEGFYMNGVVDSSSFYGAKLESSFSNNFHFSTGYAEIQNPDLMLSSNIALAGIRFKLFKKHSFSITAIGNKTSHSMYTPFTKYGNAFKFYYNSSFKKISFEINADYGSPEYTGSQQGKFYIYSTAKYVFNKSSRLDFNYFKRDDKPAHYVNDVLQTERFRKFDKYEILNHYFINRVFSIYYGGIYQLESSNQLFETVGVNFATTNTRLIFAGIINIPDTRVKISPRIDIGNISISQAPEKKGKLINSFKTYNFALNITSKNFGFYLQYRNGPFDLLEQKYYYKDTVFTKRLFVMPYYDKFLFNKKIELLIRGNYQADFENRSNIASLNNEFVFFLPKQFSVRLSNSLSSRAIKDRNSNTTFRYNSSYFQLTFRKEFDCDQPRIKHYDLQVIFYRDLNGNRVKEPNEPGINNVLANIESDYPDTISLKKKSSEFVASELLSDQTGTIEYLNLPNGSYKIKYILLGEVVGNFNREELTESFLMEEDKTIYIPYLENNKIFGSIVLNRDPLSSIGPQDISNIRIIAEDTKGNTFSALTDKQGSFVLYTPVADNYIVKVNNIFYESFDIQQPEYIVKFNGYKQFKVSFVFNEKKRKINFDTDLNKDEFKMDELKVIRKTTLSGKIRDAISLDPVEATIKIIENTTNKVVAETVSNRLNGNYSISYVAGDRFRIEVKAEGHWNHLENLYIEQVISIQNIAKDIMLNKLTDGPENQTFIIYDEKEEKDFTQNFKSGQKIPINNLNFSEKETRLSPEAYPELDRLIELLNKNKTVKIQIAGHADDTGTDRIDNLLALRRANSVQKYLTSHGLTEDRIVVKSYSNSRPLVPGTSEKAKQKNRRVEIIVL